MGWMGWPRVVSAIIAGTLAVFAYVSSNTIAANYLGILHLPGTQELVVYAGCLLGACLGFLWYNSFPASVFMGGYRFRWRWVG